MSKFLTKDVARTLDVTSKTVHDMERKGVLQAERTPGGTRLFDEADVKKLAKERAAEKKNK